MNAEDDLDLFGTHVVHTNAPETIFQQNRKSSYGNQLIDDFEKNLFFRDTRHNQEHDAKVRLSIPSPSL